MPVDEPPGLLLDASVLIDYCETDVSVLALLARTQRVYVAEQVLIEVGVLDEAGCADTGIKILQPDLEQLDAAARGGKALSFQDHLCLKLAESRSLVLVTNDRRLRRECEDAGVTVKWGLELLLELVARSELDPSSARDIAQVIRRANPFYTTDAVIDAFHAKLDDIR